MGLKIFITGATGFAGRHLVDLLKLSDFQIRGTCFPERPEHCPDLNGIDLLYLDLQKEDDVSNVVKSIKPDWIVHLAAVSSVGYSWKHRRKTLETNLMGTFSLLESARRHVPQARVLFVSSCEVYGLLEPVERSLKEEDSPKIANPYAFTKVCGELLCEFYNQIENLDIIISRSFPHTGPGQSADFVFSDWAYQIAKIEKSSSEPIITVGNLDVRRDYSDVRDVVRAYVLLLEKGKKGEVYNVCSGEAPSLKEILDILLSFSSKDIEVHVDPQKLRKTDIPLLLGNNQKIKREIGWTPEIQLKQTLEDLLGYWRGEV